MRAASYGIKDAAASERLAPSIDQKAFLDPAEKDNADSQPNRLIF
jgi:hypothetical protein